MVKLKYPLSVAAMLAVARCQGSEWQQCGGSGWTGAKSCATGLSCVVANEWYSQCQKVPDVGSSATIPSNPTTSSSIPPVSSQTTTRFSVASTPPNSTIVTASATSHVISTPTATGIKVRVMPAVLNGWRDEDWTLWGVPEANTSSTTVDGVTVSLAAGSGKLAGNQYKVMQYTFLPTLGQRMLGAGTTTESTEGVTLTLTLQGLSAGNHSLLVYHNTWENLASVATISATLNGKTVITNHTQSIRINNVYNAASTYFSFSVRDASEKVEIVFTPGSEANKRVHINGFEVDVANINNNPSFPEPAHKEEHIGQGNTASIAASWRAPKSVSAPRYNVYLAENSQSAMVLKSSQQAGTTFTFSELTTVPIYYWRVDAVDAAGNVFQGRVWKFRLAQLAFPGAEGYGRFARGGRGGKVVKVTSLADAGPGTLRNALTVETGPRTVVFDIGGIITLDSRVTVNTDSITLAGQTAPGKGVIIQGWPIGLSGGIDIVFRHIRVRPGKISNKTIDGMGMQGSNHAIFDRCSMGWSIDESFSSRGAFNITLQRSLISEPLNVAGHANYPVGTAHGYAASIGGDVGSFHHNLIAHAYGRSWSMAGGNDYAATHAGRLDIRNNVVYNFGNRVTDGGAKYANFVGNLYKKGPSSKLNYTFAATYENPFGPQQYHCAGNSMPGLFSQTSTQYTEDGGVGTIACWANIDITPAPTFQKFFAEPFYESYVETHTSTEAYKRVLSDSGVQYPVLDDHDKRIIAETFNGTTTYTGSVGKLKGIIDHENDVGGLEPFPTTIRATEWDENNDGIADWWDGSTGGDGYTPLEGYLNFMADPHIFVAPGKTLEFSVAQWAAGFVEPKFTVTNANKGTVSVSGDVATFVADPTPGVGSFTLTIQDSEGSIWEREIGVAVYAGAV